VSKLFIVHVTSIAAFLGHDVIQLAVDSLESSLDNKGFHPMQNVLMDFEVVLRHRGRVLLLQSLGLRLH